MPVLGITGTGGAGKSSLTDELIRRLRLDQGDAARAAVISIDPSRRKSGGALLGDRIRMNAINPWNGQQRVFMRSLATRRQHLATSAVLADAGLRVLSADGADFDGVLVSPGPGTPEEFAEGALPGAVNIETSEFSAHIAEVAPDKDAPVVLYCRSGRRAGEAQQVLESMGYRQVINAGGYSDLLPAFDAD